MMLFLLIAGLTLCTILSYFLIGKLIHELSKRNIVDVANSRSLHEGEVPRGGGLVIIALLLLALLVIGVFSSRAIVFSVIAVMVLAWSILSWWDDRHDLSPLLRLIIQIALAGFSILAFGYVTEIQINHDVYLALGIGGAALTLMGIIWLANLYNFMDGIDGLAASQTIIASLTLGFWFAYFGDLGLALSCFILAAASYGFLLWNWHPAKIFMGDVGSVGIGAFFAILIIYGNTRYQIPVISFVLLLGVFIFDASLTITWRMMRREKIWLPHKTHYYQRLAELRVNHARIVIGAIILMLLCSLIATASVLDRDRIWVAVVVAFLLLFAAARYVVYQEKVHHRNSQRSQ